MQKFERLLLILNLIRSRPGIRASELAAETGVSQRTVYRDILNLASQYPVFSDNGYRLLPTAYLKTMNLTEDEYNLFQTALSCPALSCPDLKSRVRTLKAKIDTVVNPGIRKSDPSANLTCAAPFAHPTEMANLQTIASTLEKAIRSSRVVEITQPDGSVPVKETLRPYHLLFYYHNWTVIGYSEEKSEFEGLSLKQIKKITLTNRIFQRESDFSLENFFHSHWGLKPGEETVVKLRFRGQAAREIFSRPHHPAEKKERTGYDEVHYAVTVQGAEEMLRWILGFGPDVEVLAPAHLRRRVIDLIKKQAESYGLNPSAETGILTERRAEMKNR